MLWDGGGPAPSWDRQRVLFQGARVQPGRRGGRGFAGLLLPSRAARSWCEHGSCHSPWHAAGALTTGLLSAGAPLSTRSLRRGSKHPSEPLHQRLQRSSRGQSDPRRPPEPSAAWGHEPSRLCPSHLCRGRLQAPLPREWGCLAPPVMLVPARGGLAARQLGRCRLLLPGERPRAGPLPARAHSEGGTPGEPPKILMNSCG